MAGCRRKRRHLRWKGRIEFPYHPCMAYLPTFWLIFMENVDKDTIHGWYGIETTWETWRKINNKKKVVSSWHEPLPIKLCCSIHGIFDAYICSNYILTSKKPRVRPHIILHTRVLFLQWHENTRFIQKHRVKQPRAESIHSICFWIACQNTPITETIHIDLLLKSCTTWDVWNPLLIMGYLCLSFIGFHTSEVVHAGARFQPSTVWPPTTPLLFRKHSTGLC